MSEFAGSDPLTDLYSVCEYLGKGNGVMASRNITIDTLIFRDKPLFHSSPIAAHNCACCRKVVSAPSHTCPGGCGLIFCSDTCSCEMARSGHSWICSCYTDGLIQQLAANDSLCHIVLAFTVYAKFLEDMLNEPHVSPLEIFDRYFSTIQSEDYCRTQHAFRNGIVEVDDEIFSNLIAPAYFGSFLATPLNLIKTHFRSENVGRMWMARGGDAGFLDEYNHSEVFSGMFLRKLIGTFVVNNLEMQLSNSFSGGSTSGTGLFKLYSKMNHSCVCNTRNEVSESGEVMVYAARDINAGEEITTTYLHVEDPHSLSRKTRNSMLRQYMFTCQCDLCCQEGGQPEDSDSSGDY